MKLEKRYIFLWYTHISQFLQNTQANPAFLQKSNAADNGLKQSQNLEVLNSEKVI